MPDSAINSPCIGICQLDKQRTCIACHRTVDEIAGWQMMDDQQKQQVLDQVQQRQQSGGS
ncbi:MAG: DUF1289 domain-containing protein [Motiliproteus sp.]